MLSRNRTAAFSQIASGSTQIGSGDLVVVGEISLYHK